MPNDSKRRRKAGDAGDHPDDAASPRRAQGQDAKSITDTQQDVKLGNLEGRIKRGELWMILLTAALVALGFMQWWLAKTQIADAKAAVELDQRAWIVVSRIEGTPVAGKTFRPIVVIKNIGKTNAYDVNIRARYFVVARGDKLQYPTDYSPVQGTAKDVVMPPVAEATIGEYLLAQDNKTPLVLTQPLIDDWTAGKFSIVLMGRVTYKDIFTRSHFLKYCSSYLLDGDWMDCTSHNEFDH